MGQFFLQAEKYLDQLEVASVGHFVEIGTSRNGDDGSTKIIAGWAAKYNRTLQTVDVDPDNCRFVQSLGIDNIVIHNQTGEEFLATFSQHFAQISFLYLDNFDWDWHPENPEQFVLEQRVKYNQLGITMTNINSQRAHLQQMMAAMPAMADKCIVVLDDTWYNRWWGHYSGKSGAVVPYLLNNGFKILETEEHPEYGTIMGRNII